MNNSKSPSFFDISTTAKSCKASLSINYEPSMGLKSQQNLEASSQSKSTFLKQIKSEEIKDVLSTARFFVDSSQMTVRRKSLFYLTPTQIVFEGEVKSESKIHESRFYQSCLLSFNYHFMRFNFFNGDDDNFFIVFTAEDQILRICADTYESEAYKFWVSYLMKYSIMSNIQDFYLIETKITFEENIDACDHLELRKRESPQKKYYAERFPKAYLDSITNGKKSKAREITFLRENKSNSFLNIEQVFEDAHTITIIFEPKPKYIRLSYIMETQQLSTESIIWIIKKLLTIISEIERLGYHHRNISPRVIFVKFDDLGKITGLKLSGFRTLIMAGERLSSSSWLIGNWGYCAPEVRRREDFLDTSKSIDSKSDVYSIGVLLYEFCKGEKLFKGESISEIKKANRNGNIKLEELSKSMISTVVINTIESMLQEDINKRVSSKEALKLPFFEPENILCSGGIGFQEYEDISTINSFFSQIPGFIKKKITMDYIQSQASILKKGSKHYVAKISAFRMASGNSSSLDSGSSHTSRAKREITQNVRFELEKKKSKFAG